MQHAHPISSWPARFLGAVSGLVAAIVALGVAELVAGLVRGWRSPVLDVGDRVVDNVPVFLKNFAIEQFGTNDKPVLLASIGVVVALYAMLIGLLGFSKKISIGLIGIALFGVIGIFMAATRRVDGSIDDGIPTMIGVSAGAFTLYGAYRLIMPLLAAHVAGAGADQPMTPGPQSDQPQSASVIVHDSTDFEFDSNSGTTRRDVLLRSGGVLGALTIVGAGAGAFGRALGGRFSASGSRQTASDGLPIATDPLPPVPAALEVDVQGMGPFVTPNSDFYRIDTALTVPQVPTDTYELKITGMVDNELSFSFEDLINREVEEHDITLTCVSNTVGGELIGHARWLGVRLDTLLEEAGIQAGADQVVGRSVDGYTCGFPTEAAMDGRNALVAFGMNGEALPLEHGFPVRLIVPGLYGYISATKWLTEIEITRFEDFESYWVPRGYSDRAPIKLMSRIDSVDGLGTLTTGADGMAAVGGVAWAQTRGISAVEVSIDEGEWQPAEMGDALNDDSWRQWAYRFTPSGTDRTRASIKCRAIDGDGVIQSPERAEPLPNGASGHHSIVVFIE